jgi:hypothetical protein
MGTTNTQSGTRIDEISEGIYRISTPLPPPAIPTGFSFNQFLVVDHQPLLFHTGPRKLFPLVREAMATVMPPEKLRFVAFSHWEPDESGALNEWLQLAPQATAVQGRVGVTVCVSDQQVSWIDTPHLPHGWDCGFLFESKTKTLLCGDLFTQGGHELPPVTESDILGPSEAFRKMMDYCSHPKNTVQLMEKLASRGPTTLACMHGSSWRGDGASLLRALGKSLDA